MNEKNCKTNSRAGSLSIGLLLSPLAVQAEVPYYGKDYSQPEKLKRFIRK
ncbi:hypothetical protein AAAC51_26955 [Priestia megaterium]